MKSSPAPFRILGKHKEDLIILRTFADHVSITVGGKEYAFPSYDASLMFLQKLTKKTTERKGVSYEHTHRKNIHTGSTESTK